MTSSELLLTFHYRLSIVVHKLLRKVSTAFKGFVSPIENRMEFTVGLQQNLPLPISADSRIFATGSGLVGT
jgi:hypothetical protein